MNNEEIKSLTDKELDSLIETLLAEREARKVDQARAKEKLIEGYLERHPKQCYCVSLDWWTVRDSHPVTYTGEEVLAKHDQAGMINKVTRLDRSDPDYEKILELIKDSSKIQRNNTDGLLGEDEMYGTALIKRWSDGKITEEECDVWE